ncbi:hypothetical protein QVD17_07947 [Tagetes erecta]|uniref:Uncharacterized protein n=1 Tax=Tagetes erecta TaxID=13708 RepID=A0AAD8KYW0_TARER|nr:hypothetical protein QVD17_07947 [Tagetes erecta]
MFCYFIQLTLLFIPSICLPLRTSQLTGDMQSRRKPPFSGHLIPLLLTSLLLSTTTTTAITSRSFFFLSEHDLNNSSITDHHNKLTQSTTTSDEQIDPGSWRPIFEPNVSNSDAEIAINPNLDHYYSVVRKLVDAVSDGGREIVDVATEIESIAATGDVHAQSLLGFLYSMGIGRERNSDKGFMFHQFAADFGCVQSKLVRAYACYRQELDEKAVILYAELAEAAVNSFFISNNYPVIEPVKIHNGAEENKDALRKFRGEDDEDFRILKSQAQKGNALAMYKIGMFYYHGLRGFRRDNSKALSWFSKAVDKGEPRSMELLGEIYARGAGVEKNYTKSLEWLTLASKQQHCSAYNGIGYLYAKGYGVEQKNYTKAKEYFEKAADDDEAGGHYNLGVMYLKGVGVKKDVKLACRHFIIAANSGEPIALYQLAKMFHTGVGLKKNPLMATSLYKIVAEKGPWSSLSRWALESYLKGEIGKAFLLYSRMAELGYEVAQSNAAWILDKYGESSMCIGELGLCTDSERLQRAHALWWQASKQGNEYAASLTGDAYYNDQIG